MSFNSTSPEIRPDDFKPFEAPHAEKVERKDITQVLKSGDAAFNVQSYFWDALLKDAWIKRELERVVKVQVDQIYTTELSDRINKEVGVEKEKGYQEGLKAGQTQGQKEGEAKALEVQKANDEAFLQLKKSYQEKQEILLNRMNALSLQLLAQKEEVLKDHEKQWLSALEYLLEMLPVAPSENWLAKMKSWIAERMQLFKTSGKVTVFVSPEQLKLIEEMKADMSSFPWTFSGDENLKSEELRVECGDGGIFFSKKECLEQVADIIKNTDDSTSHKTNN